MSLEQSIDRLADAMLVLAAAVNKGGDAPTAEKPVTKKPAAEKPATKKPAAEKPATKKPAVEETEEASTEQAPVAYVDVAKVINKLAAKNRDEAKAILKIFGAAKGPEIPEDKWASALELFTTALESYDA